MTFYRVWNRSDDAGEVYWVSAESEKHARRLVALNAEETLEPEDSFRLECEVSDEKRPPFGLIYRRLRGPLMIEKR